MAFDPHANLVSGTVLIPPTPALSGEVFVLKSGQGARFTPGTPVTMHHPAIEPSLSTAEIGYVTAVDDDTLTVTRAQEGTTAKYVTVGWRIAATITAKTLTDIEDAVETKADATFVDSQLAEVAADAHTALQQETVSRVDADTELFTQIDEVTTALGTKVDQEAGKTLTTNDYTTVEKTKLSGIAPGATQNASDNALRDRATHTGTQSVSTVTGLQAALDSKANQEALEQLKRDAVALAVAL